MIKRIICFTRYTNQSIHKHFCPACNSKQKFLCSEEEWHGYTFSCMGCGSTWMEDGNFMVSLSNLAKASEVDRNKNKKYNLKILLSSLKKMKFGLEYNHKWYN